MKAVIISEVGIEYCNVDNPKLTNKSGYIVNVIYSGLCGSDIQRIKLLIEDKIKHPILGHEIVGTINSIVGSKKTDIKVGDYVVVSPIISCKKCVFCKEGNIQFCKKNNSLGKTQDGGFADMVYVPMDNVYKIPKNSFCKELVLSDPLSVCIHALNKIGSIENKRVAIIGGGAIGEVMSRLAGYKKSREVVLITKNFKLQKNIYYKSIKYSTINDVIDKKYTDYFDVVFECVGREESSPIEIAIKITKKMGNLVVLGAYKMNYILPINARMLFSKEITMVGSNSYNTLPKNDDFHEAINLILDNKIKLDGIITHTLSLRNFSIGLDLFKNKKTSSAIKIVFENQ